MIRKIRRFLGLSTPEDDLHLALKYARRAERRFPEESKERSVANNAVRWTEKAMEIVDDSN